MNIRLMNYFESYSSDNSCLPKLASCIKEHSQIINITDDKPTYRSKKRIDKREEWR